MYVLVVVRKLVLLPGVSPSRVPVLPLLLNLDFNTAFHLLVLTNWQREWIHTWGSKLQVHS